MCAEGHRVPNAQGVAGWGGVGSGEGWGGRVRGLRRTSMHMAVVVMVVVMAVVVAVEEPRADEARSLRCGGAMWREMGRER